VTKSNATMSEMPQIEIRVSESWIRLIRFTQLNIPHGQLCIRISNSQPTELIPEHTKRRIRFDKEESIPTEFEPVTFQA